MNGSTWGNSWGASWGDTWGLIEEVEEPSGGAPVRRPRVAPDYGEFDYEFRARPEMPQEPGKTAPGAPIASPLDLPLPIGEDVAEAARIEAERVIARARMLGEGERAERRARSEELSEVLRTIEFSESTRKGANRLRAAILIALLMLQ